MAGFGSMFPAADPMAPEAYETWQDREARLGLQLQQDEERRKADAGRTWGDTARDVWGMPRRLYGALSQPGWAGEPRT